MTTDTLECPICCNPVRCDDPTKCGYSGFDGTYFTVNGSRPGDEATVLLTGPDAAVQYALLTRVQKLEAALNRIIDRGTTPRANATVQALVRTAKEALEP